LIIAAQSNGTTITARPTSPGQRFTAAAPFPLPAAHLAKEPSFTALPKGQPASKPDRPSADRDFAAHSNPDHPHSATHPSASPPTTALDRDIEPIETPSEHPRLKSSLLRSTVRYDDNGAFSLALNTANPSSGTVA
jgi:hypothetical protein